MSRFSLLIGIVVSLLVLPAAGFASDCFDCHDKADFSGRVIHAPVADGDCLTCHGPHVSRHAKLLLDTEKELCYGCHAQVKNAIDSSEVLHAPVRDGQCSTCHSPHVAAEDKLLKASGGENCFGCHESLQKDYKVGHQPFVNGQCSSCHAPHGGADQRLLKDSGSKLCFDCHRGSQTLQSKHLGLALEEMDCLSCHHPHGADNRILLRSVRHQPFAQGQCQTCHDGKMTVETCLQCHADVLESFNKVHNHLGIAGSGNACVACHDPHAGDLPGLLPENVGTVCRDCHADTFKRREKNLHTHAGWNQCTDCHQLHGTNGVAMLINDNNVCAQCHDQHKGFTHPIGEDALDPRNRQPMDCLTCHNANDGSMYRYFLWGSGERGLCVQCHLSY